MFAIEDNFFDSGSDEKKEVLSDFVSIFIFLMVLVLAISLIYAVFGANSSKSTQTAEKPLYEGVESLETHDKVVEEVQEEDYRAEMSLLKTYMEYNGEVIAMIRIKDSVLYHPIMRCESQEDYYLNRDLDKKPNSHGVPFISLGSKLNQEGNSVIYGHNISLRTRDVFCDLAYYNDLDYYKEHPIVEIITEDGVSKYLIFAYYLVDLSDTDAFWYSDTTNFLSMRKFEEYMQNVRIRNQLKVPCELEFDDCYITLSSCSNELYGSGTNRMVVMAKRLDCDEEYESIVDSAELAANPLMPEKLRR